MKAKLTQDPVSGRYIVETTSGVCEYERFTDALELFHEIGTSESEISNTKIATQGERMTAQFLVKPYYPLPLPQVYVTTSVKNWPAGSTTKTLTVECYLQSVLASTMSNISAYLNPAYNTFLAARTEEAIVNDYIETANNRVIWYPGTAFQVDPIQLGTEYGQLQVAIMKQIDSGGMTGGTEGVSLWDAWVSMTGPVH